MQDAVIVGGSFAGLSAALQLGRARRRVTVLDASTPRNSASPAAHGVPGWDGVAPAEILAKFRMDASVYETIDFVDGKVTGARAVEDRFDLKMASGDVIHTQRVVLAHGVSDALPAIPGASEAWGKGLLHCPYCHGFEVRDRPLAVLANHAMSGHQAQLLRADWSDDVTILTGIAGDFDQGAFDMTGFTEDPRPVTRLVQRENGVTVTYSDGEAQEFAAVFAAPSVSLNGTPAEDLGCACADGALGPFIRVGPMGQTSVAGVFAAGDCARPGHNVNAAIGDGATAGIGCHQSLVFPDFILPLEDSSHD